MTMIRNRYVRPFPTGSAPAPVDGLAESYRALLAMPEASATRASEFARDQNLTPVGRKAALRSWAQAEPIEALRKARAALTAGDRAIAETRAKMNTALVDKGDFAGAVLRSDIRKWVNAMPPAQRSAMLATGEYDPQIAAAILEAPAALSGVSEKQHAALFNSETVAKHPEEAAIIAHIEEAMGAVADADVATTSALRADAGFLKHEIEEALGAQTLSQRIAAMIEEEPADVSEAA
jgi:hypothetical protein